MISRKKWLYYRMRQYRLPVELALSALTDRAAIQNTLSIPRSLDRGRPRCSSDSLPRLLCTPRPSFSQTAHNNFTSHGLWCFRS